MRGLNIKAPINFCGNILRCAVQDNNLDGVRFCLENHANPTLVHSYDAQFIVAIAATSASIEVSELLITWGARIKGSSALTIASHNGRADLVKLLLVNRAEVNEMGIASTDEDPDDLEGTALHLIEKGRIDILQILLDYGGNVNQKDCTGKTVMSRMEANGGEILSSMVEGNGGVMALIIFGLTWGPITTTLNTFDELSIKAIVGLRNPNISNEFLELPS